MELEKILAMGSSLDRAGKHDGLQRKRTEKATFFTRNSSSTAR